MNYSESMTRYIPIIFILLWSTGFIGARFGLPYAEPFTLLMWRMVFVIPMFVLLIIILKRSKLSVRDATMQGVIGFFIHGVYLGGLFAAINGGMPAGLTALIMSLNPLLLAVFSGIVLNTSIHAREWWSLLLGFLGVAVVLYGNSDFTWFFASVRPVGEQTPPLSSSSTSYITQEGIIWLIVSLPALTIGTLLQKRYAQNVDLITGSSYQYAAALALFALVSFSFETGQVDWDVNLIATLVWMVVVLSGVAILLLLYMIRHGEATRVASYFYLVPPLTAFQGWLFFDERWSWLTIAGALMVVVALFINRKSTNKREK